MHKFIPTHDCNTLTLDHQQQKVVLSGWVHRRRDHGGLIFVDLRDRFGLTQIVFRPEVSAKLMQEADLLRSEWVISVEGVVISRAEGMSNPNLKTGDIEVEVTHLTTLSRAKTPPFSICDEHINVNEELRLKYRYLDMRRGKVLETLALRHRVFLHLRNFLDRLGFFEVQTPILGKSSPEGARDYLVPSRIYPGKFYALPQAPQIFKQLLMIGNLGKYFQIAPCFRDEDLRADRQPEFTQLDLEMSFSSPKHLFKMVESLFVDLFKHVLGKELKIPFAQMTYAQAMDLYGTDKPDTRFEMPLVNLTSTMEKSGFSVFLDQIKSGGIVKAICVKQGAELSRKTIDGYIAFVQKFGLSGLAWMKVTAEGLHSNIVKFFNEDVLKEIEMKMEAEPGDLILFAAADLHLVNQSLDHLRRHIAKTLNLIPTNSYAFLWVTQFPLFTWDDQSNQLVSEHHPFTAPYHEDIALLTSNPLQVRSSSYDLVLNGYELGSGSERIYDSELQDRIFQVLQLSEEDRFERFGFFLEALNYGTPPHLGMALGLDRLMMILSGTENIRDVIAFPKTQKASDLMLEAPSAIIQDQLTELKIHIEHS